MSLLSGEFACVFDSFVCAASAELDFEEHAVALREQADELATLAVAVDFGEPVEDLCIGSGDWGKLVPHLVAVICHLADLGQLNTDCFKFMSVVVASYAA